MLYELSLSIGTSLELNENCECFAQKLMSRQNLSFFAVYGTQALQGIPPAQATPSISPHKQYNCLYSCPKLPHQELEQLTSTTLPEQLQSQGRLCINTQESTESIPFESVLESFPGIFSAFLVCKSDIIIVSINQIRDHEYPSWELNQLHLLLDKFGRSVEACLNHELLQKTTERKLVLEKKLGQAKRLESLGLMAGGIAHDLGNILNPLAAYPDILRHSFSEGTKESFMLSQMQDAVDKASAMMKDLLTLTRGANSSAPVGSFPTAMPLALPVHQYLTSASFLSLQSADPRIHCQWELETESCVSADNIMITRIILNLVTNAFDALNGQGSVEIKVCDCDLSEPYEGYTTIPAGQYVTLSVWDNGEGIPQDVLDYIFEPFFSKKKLGRSGSGLGLAVVYKLVQGMDGAIDVKTGKDGTSFIVYFPRRCTKTVESEQKPSQSAMNPITSDSQTIPSPSHQANSHQANTHQTNENATFPLILSRQSARDIIVHHIELMPQAWCSEFASALASLKTDLIEEQIEKIPLEHRQLKEAIQSLAQQYSYDILLDLISPKC